MNEKMVWYQDKPLIFTDQFDLYDTIIDNINNEMLQ